MLFLMLFRGDWLCSLCRDVVQPEVVYDCENERTSGDHTSTHSLPACDQRVGHFISYTDNNDGASFAGINSKCLYLLVLEM